MSGKLTFSFWIFAICLNIVAGAWSVLTILGWFGKVMPTWGACIAGLICGEVTIPIAIIGKLFSLIS